MTFQPDELDRSSVNRQPICSFVQALKCRAADAGTGGWGWRQYGVIIPKDNLPVNNEGLTGVVLPEHDLFGNVTAPEAMRDLRKKFESVSKDITNLERYIAREASRKSLILLRADLLQLDMKRDRIADGFRAQTDRLLAQEGDMRLIKIEEP